ncbi:hypothetical protein M404DRAFT_1000622 [Pisolithus tinctorius Marx 270]|uniref:Uncharacterized protein n=1 Tax=Pisolithus tinctorius Marx 270 TaxID=870435 RepID=A0A0C3K4K3_PISTI|nr:hypothetical protein M404DRAFT_1000622 [Pisolithus tinctorius Marx 270]
MRSFTTTPDISTFHGSTEMCKIYDLRRSRQACFRLHPPRQRGIFEKFTERLQRVSSLFAVTSGKPLDLDAKPLQKCLLSRCSKKEVTEHVRYLPGFSTSA